MEENNRRALIIAYYLSKYDKEGLKNLGYINFKVAFEEIAGKLKVNKNTIKNMRDEFDPIHDNKRVGWYQRELRPSREWVIDKFSRLSERALREIVKNILSNKRNENVNIAFKEIEINEEKAENNTRTITGKRAEKLFEEYFEKNIKNRNKLIDTTFRGCGYDYETSDENGQVYEVKGAKEECTNILLTDKEWEIAEKLTNRYNLVLVSYVYDKYIVEIINNPYEKFNPKQVVETVIAVKWKINVKNDLVENDF